jgi:hypothetical protein
MTMTSYDFDQPIYLGDGLYASFDGYQVRLMTCTGDIDYPDNIIYLDDEVAMNLLDYIKKCYGLEAK